MESKDKGGRVLALAALLVGVIGLSLGFAAFSSTLNISANARVNVGTKWDVGFSQLGTTMAPKDSASAISLSGTISGTDTTGTSGGTVDLLKYTIQQDTPAVLNTAAGTSVTYSFYILNAGEIDAVLDSITMGTLTCAYVTGSTANRVIDQDDLNIGARATAGSGTIDAADCATMFTATLTIGGTPYTTSSSNLNVSLPKTSPNNKVAATLTIASTGNLPSTAANIPTSDFTVSLGATTVGYTS